MTGAANDAAWRQFICRACGWVYDEARGDPDGGLPPGTRFADIPEDWSCPLCGVTKADFEPWDPAAAAAIAAAPAPVSACAAGRGRHDPGVLIVGGGRAGWQVAEALRARDAALPITLVAACSADVYDKPLLSVAHARGLAPERLVREPAADAARRLNVRLLADAVAVRIDPATRTLRTTRGTLRWRQLVLAHGAQPRLPAGLPPALVWRVNDLAAYRGLRAALARGPQQLLVVGAGLVGCELANDLALGGHGVTLLDAAPRPLAALLPARASERLLQAWAPLPLRFEGGVQVQGVLALPDGRRRVALSDGRVRVVDQVLAATGLAAADRLARSAGLAFDPGCGGVVADPRTLATSHPDIHALGDCAAVDGLAQRFIEPIARQALAIAEALCGSASPVAAQPAAEPPTLRVKTSSLPLKLQGRAAPDAAWTVLADSAERLEMVARGADGQVQARLLAEVPAALRQAA